MRGQSKEDNVGEGYTEKQNWGIFGLVRDLAFTLKTLENVLIMVWDEHFGFRQSLEFHIEDNGKKEESILPMGSMTYSLWGLRFLWWLMERTFINFWSVVIRKTHLACQWIFGSKSSWEGN